MAARRNDVPSQKELDLLLKEVNKLRDEWCSLNREVKELKQRLQSTEQDEEKKKLMKEIDIKDIKRKLADAKYWKALSLYWQRYYEKLRADGLRSGRDVTGVDGRIRHNKKEVVKREMYIQQHQQQLLEMEQEEELEKRNRKLLEEGLKQGSVKMRYLVCITIGLPGVGKTCLKYLLMGEPPPELRSSTILAETPIRIEVSVQKISEMKIRTSGEQWVRVTDNDIMDIVGGLIILVSEQHPDSMQFLSKEATIEEPVIIEELDAPIAKAAPKVSLLQRFLDKVSKRKRTHSDPPPQSAEVQPVVEVKQISVQSSKACKMAVDTIMGRLVEVIKRLKVSSQSSQDAARLPSNDHQTVPRLDWVLFSDCGGQPKYHELLPLFLRHISAALCVLRLTDNLDKVQPVEYYSDDKPLCLPAQSQLSAKDTIKCLVNTVQSFSTQNQKPKVIFVGTHLDELQRKRCDLQNQISATTESPAQAKSHEYLETLQEKNDALIDMLESEYSDHLVYFSENMKQLLYPVNTMKRGEEELRMAKLIREAVEKSPAQEIDVPVWWLIFETLLQELAKLLKRKVLSKAECLELAHTLGFGATELEAVLLYFDKINVIRYSPKVVPNVIFTESQVPLEKVSEYIKKSYILHGEAATECTPTEGKLKYFRDHGVITRELMSEFRLHYVEGIFKEEDLAALLVDRLIFAPIPTPPWVLPPPEDEQSQTDPQPSDVSQLPTHSDTTSPEEPPKESYYFMASSLMTLAEAKLKQHRHSSPSVATLLVKFPKGQRRAGVFCCFASYVIRYSGWDIILDAKVPLYRNCIKFHLKQKGPFVNVTMIDSDSFIEVHASISKGATDTECACILPIISGSVFAGIAAACRALNYEHTYPELGFFCPGHEDSLHSASVSPDRSYWCCDVDPDISNRFEKRHHLWFGVVPDSQLLAEAHASLPMSSGMPFQALPAMNPLTVNTHAKTSAFNGSEKSNQGQVPAAASSTSSTLPTTTDQSLLQSSRNTQSAASHPLLPTHSSISSSDHGPGTHLLGDSRVQPPTSTLNPPQAQAQLSAVTSTIPGSNLPLSADEYSRLLNLLSTTTGFPHVQPSTSSAAYLPEIPDIRSVVCQPATSQPVQDYASTRRDVATKQTPNSAQSVPKAAVQTNVSSAGITDAGSASTSSITHPHTPAYLVRQPALHELDMLEGSCKTVRIINRIAHEWDQVATRLYFEGHEIRRIQQDSHGQSRKASREMIIEWLDGGGSLRKPITWATLIKALNEAELSEVAEDVISILKECDP